MKKYTTLLRQILFYGIVGVVTLGVDVTVTTTLYLAFHFPAYLASGIGFLSGFFFNFPMNRKKVFKHSDTDQFSFKTQVVLYVSLSIFNLIATSFITQFLVSVGNLKIAYAKILVTALIAVWNFTLFKTIIFSKKGAYKSDSLDERTLGDVF